MCLTSDYSDHPPIELLVLQRLKSSRRGKPVNVYFLVLKHNSLFMYDSEEQTNCAGVALIEGCKIDLYPHTLLLDEIYKKEHPLRVVNDAGRPLFEGRPRLYLYAATASEKEDWLFALRQASQPASESLLPSDAVARTTADTSANSEEAPSRGFAPLRDPRLADAVFMERLNRYVRAPTMDKSAQWLNAILGRLFFNMFRSNDLERFFRKKFERKAATIPKPFFLGDLVLRSVFVGQSLPMFSRGQLHSVTNLGELLASVDVFYPGGFRMQIETEIRWDIPKVKTIVVPIVMSIHVRRMSGRALLRIKPPPSDRLWLGFYTPPVLDMDIEPVVSSKALTWSVVKAGMMKHLHDTMAEFIVLPNMDDLTIPPLIIGDCYGGEKPFELDYLPPSLMQEARQLDLSAKGISAMRHSRTLTEEEALSLGRPGSALLEADLVLGSRSFTDLSGLDNADLAMDPLSAALLPPSTETSSRPRESPSLYDEARKSDLLAQQKSRQLNPRGGSSETEELVFSEAGGSPSSSPSTSNRSSPGRTTREVISNMKRSVSTFFRTQGTIIRAEATQAATFTHHRFRSGDHQHAASREHEE